MPYDAGCHYDRRFAMRVRVRCPAGPRDIGSFVHKKNTLGCPLERVGASERMHAVHPFFLSPEIVLHQAFDHEIMATRGLCGLLQSAPKRMTCLLYTSDAADE